ncbi:signal peptidase I [Parabacteroides timonensis]|uniref:signal peptidase I n=1 Tax=Parabacteroides timonensis TaxID=1871013 RepID=UPI00094EA65B|nr:signal peptidase I [Parabacteroides timonensis]
MAKRSFISVMGWLATIVLLVGIVMAVRHFCMESFHVSTDSMEVALHKGDYILVNKLPLKDNPGRNRVALFCSPLLKDTVLKPLFLSRCIGMPGDTIRISNDGYRVNGKLIPHSPRSLNTYIVTQEAMDEVLTTLKKLNIPLRNLKEEPFGISFSLTSFEEYQLREELSENASVRFLKKPMESYELIVPQKGRAHRLDDAALTACREAIQTEAGEKAVFRDGKLFLDGREAAFFFFDQDYYWMLSDNANEAVDSRHLGFIPRDHIIGNAWLCWYSKDRQRIFKPIN